MHNGFDDGPSSYKPGLYERDRQILGFDGAKSISSVFIYGGNYSAIHSKQGCHCERALFASEAVSPSMVFLAQHEIASGKERSSQ